MSSDQDSCLFEKLSHYIDLDDASRAQLGRLEREEREYGRHAEIYQGGDGNEYLYVVKRGWLYSYIDMADGRRQIVKIHHPGDIVGFPDMAFTETTTVLRAAEEVCLCPFPKNALDEIFERSPQLTALLFTLAVRDQAILIDLVRAMGRMSARQRLAYLLLELLAKLRVTNREMTNRIRMPLNQSEIADMLGLTNVYVSRNLIALERDGLIERGEGTIAVLKEDQLAELCDFVDRYDRLDTSWFP